MFGQLLQVKVRTFTQLQRFGGSFRFFFALTEFVWKNGLFLQNILKNGPMKPNFRETCQTVLIYCPEHIKNIQQLIQGFSGKSVPRGRPVAHGENLFEPKMF